MDLQLFYSGNEAIGPRTILVVTGFIDLSNSERLLEAGLTALSCNPWLALDLSAVDFMDAAGVAALTALQSAAERLGKTVEITAASSSVYRLLELLELTNSWSVPRPTLKEAR